MAGYGNNDYNWSGQQQPNPQQSYNFDMPEQFGSELWVVDRTGETVDYNELILFVFVFRRNFQSFDANQSVDQTANYSTAPYAGSFYDPNAYAAPDPIYDGTSGSEFDNEPPLLEGNGK